MSNALINSTPANSAAVRADHSTVVAKTIAELKQRAYANAPTCGRVRLDWMTVAQAVETFHISKRFLSSLATQGQIQTIKSGGVNSHRLVHIDDILRYLGDRLRESPCMTSLAGNAATSSDMYTAPAEQYSSIIMHSSISSDESSDSEPASPARAAASRNGASSKWVFKLAQQSNALPWKVKTDRDLSELAEQIVDPMLVLKAEQVHSNSTVSESTVDDEMKE
jgi:hypothetical protein